MDRIGKIRLKIERGNKHIQDLDLSKRLFIESDPYVVESHYDREWGDKGRTIYRVVNLPPVPDPIFLVTGDAIHNLRSALDHLAYCLAEVSSPQGFDERDISFPICECVNKHEAELHGKIKRILRKDVIDTMRSVEPYKGGKEFGDTLWRLHQLDIIDKHRLLIAAGCHFEHWGIEVGTRVIHHLLGDTTEIEVGTERVWFDPLSGTNIRCLEQNQVILVWEGDVEPQQKVHFTFDIALREPTVLAAQPLLKTLRVMADAVDNVVTRFAPFLV